MKRLRNAAFLILVLAIWLTPPVTLNAQVGCNNATAEATCWGPGCAGDTCYEDALQDATNECALGTANGCAGACEACQMVPLEGQSPYGSYASEAGEFRNLGNGWLYYGYVDCDCQPPYPN